MDRPTLRQLEIFAEVVRIGSFRGAARQFGLSQVAVSDHIRQLELRLGRLLFERVPGRNPRLTDVGGLVLDHGRNMLFACDSLIAALATVGEPRIAMADDRAEGGTETSSIPADQERPITIAGHPAVLARFQAEFVAAEEAFPDRPIALDFACSTAALAGPKMAAGAIDIALVYAVAGGEDASIGDYLWSEGWSVFVRQDHPLAREPMVDRAHLVDLPVIMPSPDAPLRSLYEDALAAIGLWPSPTLLETDDHAAVLADLGHGEAAFAAFGAVAAQFGARPGLRRIALASAPPPVEVRCVVAGHAAEDPTVAALAGLLRVN